MRGRFGPAMLLAAPLLLAASAMGRDSGLKVGAHAPPLDGAAWVTDDGKQPDMKDKVLLLEFWFAG